MHHTTPWEYRYAHRTSRMGSSVIRELLKLTEQPDIISFGGGLPAPEVFPVTQFQEACNTVLNEQGAAGLLQNHGANHFHPSPVAALRGELEQASDRAGGLVKRVGGSGCLHHEILGARDDKTNIEERKASLIEVGYLKTPFHAYIPFNTISINPK